MRTFETIRQRTCAVRVSHPTPPRPSRTTTQNCNGPVVCGAVQSIDESTGWPVAVSSAERSEETSPSVAKNEKLSASRRPPPMSSLASSEGTGCRRTFTPAASTPDPAPYGGRCGYGPRQPFLVVSPWARRNFVDHQITDQSSLLRFIEDKWSLERLDGSSDDLAGSLNGMFDFSGRARRDRLFLDPLMGEIQHRG